MIETDEGELKSTQTIALVELDKVEGYCCFVKGLYTHSWQPLSVWPNTSKEIAFEDYKEKCRLQVNQCVTPLSPVVTLRFVRVDLV